MKVRLCYTLLHLPHPAPQLLGSTHQDVDGLACPCGAHKEHWFLVLCHEIHQVGVPHSVHCGYNDGDEVGILLTGGDGEEGMGIEVREGG